MKVSETLSLPADFSGLPGCRELLLAEYDVSPAWKMRIVYLTKKAIDETAADGLNPTGIFKVRRRRLICSSDDCEDFTYCKEYEVHGVEYMDGSPVAFNLINDHGDLDTVSEMHFVSKLTGSPVNLDTSARW